MNMTKRLVRFRSFWVFPLLSVILLVTAQADAARHRSWDLAILIAIGLAIWTLLEYVFHRFLLHATVNSATLAKFINASHLAHHAAPRDPNHILVQPRFALTVSTLIYGILFALTRDLFQTAGILTGIWMGFLYYETVHYRVHMSLTHSPMLQWQRREHFYHHFSNAEQCFGVTSPVWDYVFGTARLR